MYSKCKGYNVCKFLKNTHTHNYYRLNVSGYIKTSQFIGYMLSTVFRRQNLFKEFLPLLSKTLSGS